MGETISNKIVLEGEAEYKRALADINSRLRENKSAMKAAAAEYDAAGDSMEAMYRYGDSLERTMASQNEALGLMSEHLDRVEACYGKNSREANELRTKINNMRVELSKTQTQMRQFEGSMDAAAQTGDDLKAGMDAGSAGLEQVGEAAGRANEDVQELSQSIADTMGKKIIDFAIGKEVLTTLSDGLKWAMGEAIDGAREDAHARALAGDDALSERRAGIKDKVDRQWAGRMDGMTTVGYVAAVDTALGNAGITDDARVTKLTNWVITLNEAFQQDVQSTIDRATAMVNTFGVSWEDAFDLMTKGMRDMSDGGAQMLDAFQSYGPVYKQLGYDIDDMYSAIAEAANDKVLGKDSNLNKGVENLIKTLTSGSTESIKALKELGVYASDLPGKFQHGGDTAAKAMQVVLTSLQNVTDEAKRNDLGKALFGDKIWIDSAGQIADVLLSGFNQTVNASGATADAMAAELDNLSDAWAQTAERGSQAVGKILDPMADKLTDVLQAGNQVYDALEEGAKQVEQEIENTRQSVGNSIEEMIAARDQAFRQGDIKLVEDLNEQINQALEELPQEMADKYTQMGTDAATALSDTAPDMRTSAETLTGEAVGAVTDAQGDMKTAGETLGGEGVTGLDEGLSGMRDASMSAVDGAVAELYGGVSRAYAAGQATGKAYAQGYKSALGIASPSRVMREAAQDTVSPLFDEFEQDRMRLYEAAAGLAQAVSDGYGDSAALRAEAPQGGAQAAGGADVETMAQAMQKAMSGMAFELDGNRFAVLIEPGVSRATAQRAVATIKGQGAAARSW